jgi:hypothetical protein
MTSKHSRLIRLAGAKESKEYFVNANSFAAPFFSDMSNHFVKEASPKKAMLKFVKEYKHPCGLYAANLYKNSDDYHKGKDPLVRWVCNEALFMESKTYVKVYKDRTGHIQLDDKWYDVEDPTGGKII